MTLQTLTQRPCSAFGIVVHFNRRHYSAEASGGVAVQAVRVVCAYNPALCLNSKSGLLLRALRAPTSCAPWKRSGTISISAFGRLTARASIASEPAFPTCCFSAWSIARSRSSRVLVTASRKSRTDCPIASERGRQLPLSRDQAGLRRRGDGDEAEFELRFGRCLYTLRKYGARRRLMVRVRGDPPCFL